MDAITIKIGIINYPGAMQSAVHGLEEMFILANNICKQHDIQRCFSTESCDIERVTETINDDHTFLLQAVLIPPSIANDYYLSPDKQLKDWIKKHHARGAITCSACAGAFILASTGLLEQRPATTHWDLAAQFSYAYPNVALDVDKTLINDGDIITADGIMSWIDLGLELVAQFTHPHIMRQLGKYLIVDTGLREQRYYRSFVPKLDHGDPVILKIQHYMQIHFNEPITITALSKQGHLSERTFLRRFVKATGLRPAQYLQRLRIQKACDLIETTNSTFETISSEVGYEDNSAFRKTFVKIIGLTPKGFKTKFVNS
ncbi:transcriptional regulator, AraC family with amidase-like domain [Nitrosomonas cryotolerans]|uniref:Transcriptional regulator GlxA family, contains an amidase domain and an AraC-type DNA-binding HTH domain n=1 Tax=Nitrosomonas cryotolerans ATCC 49181 TaxID=1131553 RepID=A0A1N6FD85_9PROT|nr:helix-turn-helix domain-containing protein [Nitrosomonas cryotolerans]SFQ00761.1 transcriptional regulator, AraC family with amidase-like domain [Nitrosomonas cryotolerans]SIN93212.1 Transcriptional regulator GlxA family, contains an amidase domain and an AraC-type DNA-binding HTH domain [Nitrosomonas cryotolerans ATCC 49181]